MMQVVTPLHADEQNRRELASWVAGTGPMTPFVRDLWMRNSLTFGAALITRHLSAYPHLN